MHLQYKNYVAIRDLMADVESNEDPTEQLTEDERATLAIINHVIEQMEKKRREEDAGLIPKTRKKWIDGRMVRVAL